MIYVELDSQFRFVQYHTNTDTVSEEHRDYVIKITDELQELLLQKMPWYLTSFDVNKTYDVDDIELFVEIVLSARPSDEDRIAQLEQMINHILTRIDK